MGVQPSGAHTGSFSGWGRMHDGMVSRHLHRCCFRFAEFSRLGIVNHHDQLGIFFSHISQKMLNA